VQTLTQIKQLLEARGLSPRKSLGQNFLIDHNLVARLVEASGLEAGDLVLEVGPGTGVLTEALIEAGCDVIACELDRGLADLLRERLGDRMTLIEGDCLDGKRALNPSLVHAIADRPFRLVANLPYGAASPLMLTLAAHHPTCASMHVTIQKEVAQRLRATPGSKDYGGLSVIVQALCDVARIADLPPHCFWPRPKVTSEMVSITRRGTPLTADPDALSDLCHRLFSQRRKQIGSVLGRQIDWPQGIEGEMRAENLTVAQIVALCDVVR
jgi:16S rRNA (adenine1518-N6/adenine1519-N6)-dimethyltransferase